MIFPDNICINSLFIIESNIKKYKQLSISEIIFIYFIKLLVEIIKLLSYGYDMILVDFYTILLFFIIKNQV